MSRSDRRSQRQRVYSLVALGLVCVLGIVAMGAMLARGHEQLGRKVYRYPHKTLLHLAKAQNRFYRKDLDGDGLADFATSLEELERAGTITRTLSAGELEGYRYSILRADGTSWAGVAAPAEVTSSALFYYVDQSYVIRAREGAPADASSPVYWSPARSGWGR